MITNIAKIIVIGVVFAIALAFGASAQEQSSGGIGGRPANPDPNNPRTQSIFIHTLEPGESVDDQVRISNNSSEKQVVELLVVDGIVTSTGDYTCKQNSEEKTGIANTITLKQERVELEPNTNKVVDFTVKMPEDADVGGQNACLVFQAPQNDEEVAGGNIRLRTRQAIRLVATVPGDLRREVAITNFDVSYDEMMPEYAVTVKNTGNVSVDADTRVEVKNLLGTTVVREGGQYPVLANQELEKVFSSTLEPLLGGVYKANVVVTYNSQPGAFGLEQGDETQEKASSSKYVYIAPSPTGTVIWFVIGVGLIAAVVYAARRIKHARTVRQHWGNHHVKQGETLQSLADSFHTDWKTLARANKLKAPYEVREGDTVRVPKKK